MAVSGGQGVACAVLYRARAVATVMKLPAYGVAVDTDNVGITVVLAVQCKRLVGGAGVLPPVYDDYVGGIFVVAGFDGAGGVVLDVVAKAAHPHGYQAAAALAEYLLVALPDDAAAAALV